MKITKQHIILPLLSFLIIYTSVCFVEWVWIPAEMSNDQRFVIVLVGLPSMVFTFGYTEKESQENK